MCAPEAIGAEQEALSGLLGELGPSGTVVRDRPLGMHRLTLTVEACALPGQVQSLTQRAGVWAAKHGVAHAVLTGALAEIGPGLIVSDVDSTLITAEVVELIADLAGSGERVAAVTERAMRGEIDFTASLRERVATLAGLDAEALEGVRERVRLSPGAADLVEAAGRAGCSFALVSGGFAEIVEPLAAQLGITQVRANRLEVRSGVLTGRTAGSVVDAHAKAEQLLCYARDLGVGLDRVVAVGDGANDLQMMAVAGLGIAYRAKPIVRDHADASIPFPRLDTVAALTGLV